MSKTIAEMVERKVREIMRDSGNIDKVMLRCEISRRFRLGRNDIKIILKDLDSKKRVRVTQRRVFLLNVSMFLCGVSLFMLNMAGFH